MMASFLDLPTRANLYPLVPEVGDIIEDKQILEEKGILLLQIVNRVSCRVSETALIAKIEARLPYAVSIHAGGS